MCYWLGRNVGVKTKQTHYKGVVKGVSFNTGKYDVQITEVIKGKLSVGRRINVSEINMHYA